MSTSHKRESGPLQKFKDRLMRKLFGEPNTDNAVVIVTRADLFPTDHGAAVRTIETARALGAIGLSVGIVSDCNSHWYQYSNGGFVARSYPFWIRLVCLPSVVVKLWHYAKDLPYSNSFLYLPLTGNGFFWRTMVVAKKINAGVLQAEFPAYAKPCIQARELLDAKVVLVEHNVEYERMRAQVAVLTDGQYQRLRQIELGLCEQSDAVVCVSGKDRQKLSDDGVSTDLLSVISHGVNLADYRLPAKSDLRHTYSIPSDHPILVYHGTFSYPPNLDAMRIFADHLLPALQQKGLQCHVLAIGKSPPANRLHPDIHFTGSVPQLAPWLKSADMAVIPLTEGGGTRLKIIECFAASLPVISTSKGIEGIPIEAGKQALVIDDWVEMAEKIIELWQNPEQRETLASAGAEFVQEFDWSRIAERYCSLYSQLKPTIKWPRPGA